MAGYNIIIYGIDKYTEFVTSSINKKHKIVGVSDSFSNFSFYGRYPFIKNIKGVQYDYVVVTARNRGVRDSILESLIKQGVPHSKILSFFELFHEEKVEKIMEARKEVKFDGLIIGLSHSAYGLNPRYLSGNWVNLATSSEGIYYHFEVLKKCLTAYKKCFVDLKYIVIDLYDYDYLSFDTSLSSQALLYWVWGGCPELHNYQENSIFGQDIEHELSERYQTLPAYYPKRTKEELEIRKKVFNQSYVYANLHKYYTDVGPMNSGFCDFPNEFSNAGHIEETPLIPATALLQLSRKEKRFKSTVKENTKILHDMMALLRDEVPNAKVILTLIPRYKELEEIHAENRYMMNSKKLFKQEISKYANGESVFFLDMKGNETISNNHFLWRDESHLNYQGSIALTTVYDQFIRGLSEL